MKIGGPEMHMECAPRGGSIAAANKTPPNHEVLVWAGARNHIRRRRAISPTRRSRRRPSPSKNRQQRVFAGPSLRAHDGQVNQVTCTAKARQKRGPTGRPWFPKPCARTPMTVGSLAARSVQKGSLDRIHPDGFDSSRRPPPQSLITDAAGRWSPWWRPPSLVGACSRD